MKSKHLEGNAVDLMAYLDGRGTWELNVYDEVADAMKQAARELEVKIRWERLGLFIVLETIMAQAKML